MRKEIVLAIGLLVVMPVLSIASDTPHNNFENAAILHENAKGTLSNDMAFYKFYVAKGITMDIQTKGNNDVDLYLYNPEKEGAAYSCSYTPYEEITYTADETGYWYAKVVATKGNADYDITLNLLVPQNDAGYSGDAGNSIVKSFSIFPGEPIDGTPGRANTGMLYPPSDKDDWYTFSVCKGQTIDVSLIPEHNYDVELADQNANVVANSTNSGSSPDSIEYKADSTGSWFIHVYAVDNTPGNYTLNVKLQGQNDAGSGGDAGNTIGSAMAITAGTYDGYLDYSDRVDWYSFSVNSGETIKINLKVPRLNDFDAWLYDPNGNLVAQGTYYGDDEISYPADVGGAWKLKIDMFPGWGSEWDSYPVEVYKYGSGAYTLTLSFGGTAEKPSVVPQPDITPIAQTFVVSNDPNSNKDEYSYIAAIPAANYMDNGKRYVSPIVYKGDTTITDWFGTVDDTTNYLLEDWNAYLSRQEKEAKIYNLEDEPIKAAANLATKAWKSSDEAVVVMDGSNVTDNVKEVFTKSATLPVTTKVIDVRGDSSKVKDFQGQKTYPFWIGKKWGAVSAQLLNVNGQNIDLSLIGPKYREDATDWWPYNDDREDMFYPVALPGPYAAVAATSGTNFNFRITLYQGDRYKIKVDNEDSALRVTINSEQPSKLMVYLVDPYGNIRAPDMPSWNGAPIKPIHEWNGNKTGGDERTYSHLIVNDETSRSAVVNHPMKGTWTAIVVPYKDEKSSSISYTIKAEIREYNPERLADGIAAANGAVIASMKHLPLLYANKDGLPDETSNALKSLGVSRVTFVTLPNSNSDAALSDLSGYNVKTLSTMQDIVNAIKELRSENYITVTSMATDDGYFAQAAYLAAYHGSPVLRVGEMGKAYHWADLAHQFAFYLGDYYHGCRSIGHLSMASKPIMDYIKNGEIPPLGYDEELRWLGGIVKEVYSYVDSLGLNEQGREMYGFVAPKSDIRFMLHHALIGNESSAGQFVGETPAEMASYVERSVLYPAIIFGNPYRNYTTSSLMNFADGGSVGLNNGERMDAYNGRVVKDVFSLYGRQYRGHCIWNNLLYEFNRGASAYYYVGHGTGGSGVEEHPIWGGIGMDGWHGYEYWTGKTPRTPGGAWYDPEPPRQYDIVHFKWCDQLWQNLHSMWVHFSSCTTAWHFAPDVYLSHGAIAYYGNCGTGILGYNDLWDQIEEQDIMKYGYSIGDTAAKEKWKFERDFTTMDPTSIYGSCSMTMESLLTLYGDPSLTIYSPAHWSMPIAINSQL